MKIPVDKYGDLECGEQYYAVQWKSPKCSNMWMVHRRDHTLESAIKNIRVVDVGEPGIEWRIVYVTEMIRVVDYGNV
jgi:hypothetical protein